MIRKLTAVLASFMLAAFMTACTPDGGSGGGSSGGDEGGNNTGGTPVEQTISIEQARSIALERIPGASETNVKYIEMDTDDGHVTYEGEIIYDGTEYEFEISAEDGTIIEWEIDRN